MKNVKISRRSFLDFVVLYQCFPENCLHHTRKTVRQAYKYHNLEMLLLCRTNCFWRDISFTFYYIGILKCLFRLLTNCPSFVMRYHLALFQIPLCVCKKIGIIHWIIFAVYPFPKYQNLLSKRVDGLDMDLFIRCTFSESKARSQRPTCMSMEPSRWCPPMVDWQSYAHRCSMTRPLLRVLRLVLSFLSNYGIMLLQFILNSNWNKLDIWVSNFIQNYLAIFMTNFRNM